MKSTPILILILFISCNQKKAEPGQLHFEISTEPVSYIDSAGKYQMFDKDSAKAIKDLVYWIRIDEREIDSLKNVINKLSSQLQDKPRL